MIHPFFLNLDRKRILFYHNGEAYSYTRCEKALLGYYKRLSQLNDSRVGVVLNNSIEMIFTILALSMVKKSCVLINTRLTLEEISSQLDSVSVKTVISHRALSHQVDKKYRYKDVASFLEKDAVESNGDLLDERESISQTIDAHSCVLILFTSGTTGHAKAVPLTWKNLLSSAEASKANLGVEKSDNWGLVLPLYHIGGVMILIRSLYNQSTLTLYSHYDRQSLIRDITEKKISLISLVPTMLFDMIDCIDVHALRAILLGGSKPSDTLLQRAQEKQLPIFQTYGMTETSSQVVTLSYHKIYEKIGSVGQPLTGVCIDIREKDRSGIGTIFIKGDMVTEKYLNGEAIEWLNTGDIGYFDEEGFLYLVSRRTDLIISGGENIYPHEIESKINGLKGIKACAVSKQFDKKWGERPILYVVLDKTLETAKVKRQITQTIRSLAKFKRPVQIFYIDALPKNSLGKIMRHKLEILEREK